MTLSGDREQGYYYPPKSTKPHGRDFLTWEELMEQTIASRFWDALNSFACNDF
jgi:hypothetical protein